MTFFKRVRYSNVYAIELAALVAYYYTIMAPEPHRVACINVQHVVDFCTIAGRELPSNPKSALYNADNHGEYLTRVGKGVFELTEKGESMAEALLGLENEIDQVCAR